MVAASVFSRCIRSTSASVGQASADPVSAGRVYGFPSWYADTSDTRLEPCLDANDPNCVVLGTPGVYDPTVDLNFPTNFPTKFPASFTTNKETLISTNSGPKMVSG